MEFHFTKMLRRDDGPQEGTLASLQKLWSRYINYWKKLSTLGIVASPALAYPTGNPKLLASTEVGHRRVKTNQEGKTEVVTHKLLTPVPLHLSDDEATKLVFEQIKHDFKKAQTWVQSHLDTFFSDHEKGKLLVKEIQHLPSDSKLRELFTNKKLRDKALPFAIKYFKEKHEGYIDTSQFSTLVYPNRAARGCLSKVLVARHLGIPGRSEAMALMAFLASHDGRFTESALSSAKLFDTNGKRINAVHTDAGMKLSVLKERDATGGWQDVLLDREASEVVDRWIQVTTPLRKHMKAHHIAGWQNLIIYTGNPLGAPSYFSRTSNIHSTFRQFALANKGLLGRLAEHVTIPRIRSTRGVLVFLKNMNLAEMARELGNTSETSLRHYLPDSLWEYFVVRWLRIFQNLLIVEATKNTSYMQRALRFESAEEMDKFLCTHALKPLLPALEAPSDKDSQLNSDSPATAGRQPSELMVAASPGIFSTLLSIAEAS